MTLHESNPIIEKMRTASPDWTIPNAQVEHFDPANGAAWSEAGEPNDTPGSEWWDFEEEAWRWAGRQIPCCPAHAEAEEDRAPGEVFDFDGIDMTGHGWAVAQNDNMSAGNRAWRGENA